MPRGVIDYAALAGPEAQALRAKAPDGALPFDIRRIGHVVLYVADLERAVDFYTRVLGFRVSDVYPDTMMDGGMVFMRCNADHHGVALVGAGAPPGERAGMHHMAFEVATVDEVLKARAWLEANGVGILFEGRRRAGAQVAVEFRDPDGHWLEIYWGLDKVPEGPDGPAGADGPGEKPAIRPPGEWREVFSLEDALDDAPPGQDTTLADPSLRRDRGIGRP
ncbi:MAG: VOC family protein [Rhodospirillaceae bacterium]|nr:VOC family protein [Rhodospirillaceae bacterium]